MNPFAILFGKKEPNDEAQDELDKLIAFTKDIVVRSDLIENIVTDYKSQLAKKPHERLEISTQTYLLLEDFILKNKPLVVQKEYSRDSLHEELRRAFDIQKLPEQFRLLLLPEKEQLFMLYGNYTNLLADYILHQVGKEKLQEIVSPIVNHTFLNETDFADHHAFNKVEINLSSIDKDEITKVFKQVNTALYQHISNSFGEKTAKELTTKQYQKIKEDYQYDLVAQYLKGIPEGVLDRERVAFMTRADLEKQAMIAATEEKLRREMAEKLANNLQEENSIIEGKVKEQTAIINQEKEAAQRSEAKLLASVKGLSLGFILTDTKEMIITSNEAAKKILQIPQTLQHVSEIADQLKKPEELMQTIKESRDKNAPVEIEASSINNQILQITVTPVTLTYPQKEYIGAAILLNDITEAKRLEQTKDEFFAIASHELRTPLTAIQGSATLLKSYYIDKDQDEKAATLIRYIEESCARLLDIVGEFLNVSRLEQGRILFNKQEFNVDEILKDVIDEELKNLAERKKLSINYNSGDKPLTVFADKEKVKQVIVNIIGNAIKFTEIGGITITTDRNEKETALHITDTGNGIAPDNQKLLFQKFKQVDNILTHDVSKGTGLGLYISKKLIENMGGRIFLEKSVEGEGSTFTFTLPSVEKTS